MGCDQFLLNITIGDHVHGGALPVLASRALLSSYHICIIIPSLKVHSFPQSWLAPARSGLWNESSLGNTVTVI